MASFFCKDLHANGLSLISNSSDEFTTMLDDIRRRTQAPNRDRPPFPRQPIPDNLEFAVILLNHSEKAIAISCQDPHRSAVRLVCQSQVRQRVRIRAE